jgi:hypothetical protein
METLADIAEELGKDLEKLQYAGKTVTVKFKVSLHIDRTCELTSNPQAHTFESQRIPR